ncbi:MAG: sigma-70 family RNA polymerase sigma factor [Verrucomicrobiales bacterium]|nr:sigma-70 family RNA polymerase sigma factor [Verrucomicrobiales bacterium]
MTEGEQHNLEWRELLEEWGARLLLFARQQTPEPAEAEDLVQEALVRFWKARSRGAAFEPPLLFTLVRRIAIDRARQLHRRRVQQETLAAEAGVNREGWFDPPLEERERAACLEAALRGLPGEQREVVVLRVWGGLTFEQVGETLAISPHTAASRYRYALGHMRKTLNTVLA